MRAIFQFKQLRGDGILRVFGSKARSVNDNTILELQEGNISVWLKSAKNIGNSQIMECANQQYSASFYKFLRFFGQSVQING